MGLKESKSYASFGLWNEGDAVLRRQKILTIEVTEATEEPLYYWVTYSAPRRAFSNSSPFFQVTWAGWLAASHPRAKPKRAMAASEV